VTGASAPTALALPRGLPGAINLVGFLDSDIVPRKQLIRLVGVVVSRARQIKEAVLNLTVVLVRLGLVALAEQEGSVLLASTLRAETAFHPDASIAACLVVVSPFALT